MRYACDYEGSVKVADRDGHVTKLYCLGHANDWLRQRPGGRLLTRLRRFPSDLVLPCQGDWPLPAVVP